MKTAARSNILHPGSPAIRRAIKGFTLVEMMMAMTIIAILMAVGIPQFSGFSASRAVRSHVMTLATAMRLARTEAVKRSVMVSVCPSAAPEAANPVCANASSDWTTGWVVFTNRGDLAAVDGNDQVIRVQPVLSNSGGVDSTVAGAVNFFPTGVALGGARQFRFLPTGATHSQPTANAKRMCQSAVGSTRMVDYTQAC